MKKITKLKFMERLFRFGIVATIGATWYLLGYVLRMYVPLTGDNGVIYTDVFSYMLAVLMLLFILVFVIALIGVLIAWIWRG